MQMQLPIFPGDTKLINACLGFRKSGDYVYYLHNGSSIFCLREDDMNSYRSIRANLMENGLCKCSEPADALGVGRRNIERYVKNLREKGSGWFLKREQKRGQAHKLTDGMKERAEKLINEFYSVSDVARILGVDLYRIVDEWGIEFLGEGRRRTDLVRLGFFTTEGCMGSHPF